MESPRKMNQNEIRLRRLHTKKKSCVLTISQRQFMPPQQQPLQLAEQLQQPSSQLLA